MSRPLIAVDPRDGLRLSASRRTAWFAAWSAQLARSDGASAISVTRERRGLHPTAESEVVDSRIQSTITAHTSIPRSAARQRNRSSRPRRNHRQAEHLPQYPTAESEVVDSRIQSTITAHTSIPRSAARQRNRSSRPRRNHRQAEHLPQYPTAESEVVDSRIQSTITARTSTPRSGRQTAKSVFPSPSKSPASGTSPAVPHC